MEKLETAPVHQTLTASLDNSIPVPSVTYFPNSFHFKPVYCWLLTFGFMSLFWILFCQYLALLDLIFDATRDVGLVFLLWP